MFQRKSLKVSHAAFRRAQLLNIVSCCLEDNKQTSSLIRYDWVQYHNHCLWEGLAVKICIAIAGRLQDLNGTRCQKLLCSYYFMRELQKVSAFNFFVGGHDVAKSLV
eukprot:gnl/MRDRNA2_/MRDRNA2_558174_c0_seq1.p1 gnl/MRDRNA2_/MRDRNA2_558174_c0~~gnl/MRDRNA2_/MRDRNA2_558174_c0_seq1.p1  ORF type:complete len:107 (-),score=16.65 gnl/MRDRNA2_/MRDRNA2_558174_c0_seq1:279-599(-)